MSLFNHPRAPDRGKLMGKLPHHAAADAGGAYCAGGGSAAALAALPAGVPHALHFFVRYSLREYIAFMWQHGGFLIRRRRIAWPASLYLRLKSTASAALNFVLLGRGRRTYEFTIDQHGIVRTSGGVTLINWADVTSVRSYPRGLMLVLKHGTLPIPFRCLNEAQRSAMRTLTRARRSALTP